MPVRGIKLSGPWTDREVKELREALAPLPRAWVEGNPYLSIFIRRDVLRDAPPTAPGHSKYEPAVGGIVVYDKGVYAGGKLNTEQFRRSVYHELAHSILRTRPSLLVKWRASTSGDGYVDSYARTSPAEDFCDSFSEFFIYPDQTAKAVPAKAAFLRRLLAASTKQEKIAMSAIYGFADEVLTKVGAAGGLREAMRAALPRLRRGATSKGAIKGLALGGGGAAIGGAVGKKKGEEEGYEEGTSDLMDVAQRARQIGRREGAALYHRAMIQRMGRRQQS